MEWGASILTTDPKLLKDITEGYEADPYFLNIVDHLKKEKDKNHTIPKDMKFLLSRFVWDDTTGLLYKTIVDTQLLCIPRVNDLTLHRIIEAHDIPLGGHFGRDKTLANLAKNFFWPGMTTDVEDYVKSCNNCQKNKVVKRNPLGLLYPHDGRPAGPGVGGRPSRALDFIVQLPTTKSCRQIRCHTNSSRQRDEGLNTSQDIIIRSACAHDMPLGGHFGPARSTKH